jgi:hypothetical protein
MSDSHSREIDEHVVVVAVQHDASKVWLLNGEASDPVVEIQRPNSELIHVRGGQERHLHSTEANESPYFTLIRNKISHATHVILFGHGKGNSNAKNKFENFLEEHDYSLRQRCIDGGNIDFAAMTNGQVVALAKSVWARQ